MTPPVLAGVSGGPLADEMLVSPAPLSWWAHVRAWIRRMDGTALRRLSAWPPAARLEAGYDPFIGNPYGRSFKLGVRKKF